MKVYISSRLMSEATEKPVQDWRMASVRLSDDDQAILERLQKKLGANITQLLRQGIRALAEKEGVAA